MSEEEIKDEEWAKKFKDIRKKTLWVLLAGIYSFGLYVMGILWIVSLGDRSTEWGIVMIIFGSIAPLAGIWCWLRVLKLTYTMETKLPYIMELSAKKNPSEEGLS